MIVNNEKPNIFGTGGSRVNKLLCIMYCVLCIVYCVGLYIFSVTVIAEGDSATPVELFLNRVSIGSSGRRSSQSTGSYPTGSINLNLVLNKDDVISVMARPLNNGIVGFVTGLVSDPSDVIFTGYLQQVIYQ